MIKTILLLAGVAISTPVAAQNYYARQVVKPAATPTAPSRPAPPAAPNWTGAKCGDLVQGWTVASGANSIKIWDIYYSTAAQNAIQAKTVCSNQMTGPGICYIVAGSFPGLSTVYRTTGPVQLVPSNDPEHYAINCN